MEINDPVEKIVAAALDARGITYRHDDPLDFECGDFAIEVKAFSTPRTERQIKDRTDVILIQGRQAAHAFANLLALKEMKDVFRDLGRDEETGLILFRTWKDQAHIYKEQRDDLAAALREIVGPKNPEVRGGRVLPSQIERAWQALAKLDADMSVKST